MSTVGVIYVAYQAEDLVESSLQPWIDAREAKLGGDEFVICAVSVPFTGFDHGSAERDKTRSILGAHAQYNRIDHTVVTDKPMTEVDARGQALNYLVHTAKVDIVWLVDSDEDYTQGDIEGALRFARANPFVTWFKLPLRNYVFTPKTYLAEPFIPPRIFRVAAPGQPYRAHSFYDDNNVTYGGTITRDLKRDSDFASMTIPTALCHPKHWTWMSDERGKRKSEYQALRWNPPNGNGCSFTWDEASNQLIWNEAYFKRTGQPLPEIVIEGVERGTLEYCKLMFVGRALTNSSLPPRVLYG